MEVTEVVNKWIERFDMGDDWPQGLDIGTVLDRYIFPELERRLRQRGRER